MKNPLTESKFDIEYFFTDRIFRLPRIWSNNELKQIAKVFTGSVVNVSGWKDEDKEGSNYKDYFTSADSYTITNYKTEACGFQGNEGEIFLDLEQPLPDNLCNKFDVVFNHTVLEHIFEIEIAFKNLCKMTRDVVILVVPFLQQMHTDYGDYWRMTPLAVKRMFEKNNLHLQYLSFNGQRNASVYIFAIATKNPEKWLDIIPNRFSFIEENAVSRYENYIGCNAIYNRFYKMLQKLGVLLAKISK